jgi:peptidoglycan glycosyltransferase
MDRQVRRLGIAFLAMFVVLFAQVNFIQVFAANSLKDNPANSRLILAEYRSQRGAILARDERTVLARSVATKDDLKYLRVYPHGALYGQITGYYSFDFGRSGLEASQNDWLAGTAPQLLPETLVDELLGRPKRGATVVTTIDAKLQETAARALGSLPGAVVAMNPRNGEVLAMVSNPSFDPSPLASHDGNVQTRAWKRVLHNPGKPLIARAAQELYPPGSTFKLITTTAALEDHKIRLSDTFPIETAAVLSGVRLSNANGESCGGTFVEAFAQSCNSVFAPLGVKVGKQHIVQVAERYGFNEAPTIPGAQPSQIPQPSGIGDDLDLGSTAIGQGQVLASPLEMASIAATIGNHGLRVKPHLIVGERLQRVRVTSPLVAATLRKLMIGVVKFGTGTAADISGVQVAGKTGTAELGLPNGQTDAWFTSFAPARAPVVAVCVWRLRAGAGGSAAAPIAHDVLKAGLLR